MRTPGAPDAERSLSPRPGRGGHPGRALEKAVVGPNRARAARRLRFYGRPGRPSDRPIGRTEVRRDEEAGPTPATTGPWPIGVERASERSGGRFGVELGSDGWNVRPKRRIRTAR